MSNKDDDVIEVESDAQDEAYTELEPDPPQASGGSGKLGLALSLLALIGAGAALYFHFQGPQTAAVDPASIESVRSRAAALEQRLQEIAAGREASDERLVELEGMQERLSGRLAEQQDSGQLEERLAQLRQGLQQLENRLSQVRQGQQQLQGRLSQLEQGRQQGEQRLSQLAEQQQLTDNSVRELFRRGNRDDIDRALAEIEHLMNLALQNLALQDNPDAALEALQAADDRIRNLDEPGLLPVRRQLTSDINALQAVEDVDISGLSLFLADLAGRVSDLPLSEEVLVPVAPEPGSEADAGGEQAPAWRRLLSGVWQEIRGLVVITRSDATGEALLMPDERYFLYQNLRLQLETARTAVFRRDTGNLQASLELIIEWLEDYFDTDSSAVSNVLQSLREMTRLTLQPDLPDISSSLESLRAFIRERAATPASGEEGEAPS